MRTDDPRRRPLQLFTGKGGVGKTTLTVSCALAWAARGHRPLIVELGDGSAVTRALGRPHERLGWEPRELAPGVHATHAAGSRAVLEVLASWLGVRALAARALRSEALNAFTSAAPGVSEVAIVERLLTLLGAGWGPVLVDAEATGHARMFLALPEVFAALGASGPVGALLERARTLFADAERSALHLVTTAEALPVQETIELDASLRAGRRVALGVVAVAQRAEVSSFSARRLDQLATQAFAGPVWLAAELRAAALGAEAEARGVGRIERLRQATGREVVVLPRMEKSALSREDLSLIGERFLAGEDARAGGETHG
jgi:anion-transporting  ArsA/GET3 family ATPase